MFETEFNKILEQIDAINPIEYGKTRNYIDGAVTKLSPYISRGVISTKLIATKVLSKGYKPKEIDLFLKELAWRDYFQQVWLALNDCIDKDIKQPQPNVANHQIASAIVNANTSIDAIDNGIKALYETGYIHNHLRMYVASIACNIAQSHWLVPARWMYYHLLDADWASNACSWQWTAASFSNKKYVANQENINKYCHSNQQNTFLDIPYESFKGSAVPNEIELLTQLSLTTTLPNKQTIDVDANLPTFIYHFYNLDPLWNNDKIGNRILLLEPSFFTKYPSSSNVINFILSLSKNIENIQVYVGEFDDLINEYQLQHIYFKEHPTAQHYKGFCENRDWMFEKVTGYFPSFFAYWKKCEKYLK
jgi:deoxyribodipyrimidine photo-lyase